MVYSFLPFYYLFFLFIFFLFTNVARFRLFSFFSLLVGSYVGSIRLGATAAYELMEYPDGLSASLLRTLKKFHNV